MLSSIQSIFEKNRLALFVVFCVLQLALIAWLIFQYERALEKGQPVIIKAEFYDPYDPFRGRYINLNPERVELTNEQQQQAKTHSLLTIKTNAQHELINVGLLMQAPKDDFYLKVKLNNFGIIQWPFSRYYMQEDLAIKADDKIVQAIRDGKVRIQFRIYKGIGVIEKVFIGSQTLEAFIKQKVP